MYIKTGIRHICAGRGARASAPSVHDIRVVSLACVVCPTALCTVGLGPLSSLVLTSCSGDGGYRSFGNGIVLCPHLVREAHPAGLAGVAAQQLVKEIYSTCQQVYSAAPLRIMTEGHDPDPGQPQHFLP